MSKSWEYWQAPFVASLWEDNFDSNAWRDRKVTSNWRCFLPKNQSSSWKDAISKMKTIFQSSIFKVPGQFQRAYIFWYNNAAEA